MFTIREKLLEARALMDDYRYAEARAVLRGVDHPTAKQWFEEIRDYRDNIPPEDQHIKRKNDDYWVDDSGQEYEYVVVPQQDYTVAAVVTLVLYFIGYVPGLIVNLLMWDKARQERSATGITPTGMGCLSSLLILFAVVPFIFVCMICPFMMSLF